MYLRPCIDSDRLNPSTIMSDSIEQEELVQFLKYLWAGSGALLYLAIEQVEQYLLRTPMNRSFLVCAPKITPTPELALQECLWLRLLHPASTTTVHAGMPSNVIFLTMACSRSLFPADSRRLVTRVSKANPSDLSMLTKEYCDSDGMFMLISCSSK